MRRAGGHTQHRSVVVAIGAAIAALVLSSVPALSQASEWLRWGGGNATGAVNPTYDRDFIKEWEKNPPKGFPTIAADNLGPLRAAIARYEDIVRRGGWQPIPDVRRYEGKALQPGQRDAAVALVSARLMLSGDLDEGHASAQGSFDGTLERGVKRFQATNGLAPTGLVDERTAAAMNVPADVRLKQLKINLGRIGELAASRPRKYVIVNIPAAHVEAVENGVVVSRHTGVVGKTERQTPLLRSMITNLNFNPIWTLPPTVVTKDLIPKGIDMQKRNENVLAKFGIDAYDATGRKVDTAKINWASATPQALSYRQQPGKENPLGFLKINFDSANSVYMHDTPSENLFGRNVRAASSGCVRVANIDLLATWLLAPQGWTAERVQQMRAAGTRLDVTLKQAVPLNFVYITAWATPDGVVQFRRDLYQKDGVGALASGY